MSSGGPHHDWFREAEEKIAEPRQLSPREKQIADLVRRNERELAQERARIQASDREWKARTRRERMQRNKDS